MKWQCPTHKTFIYFSPGRCLICQAVLEPVPAMPDLLSTILSDKEVLKASLELATNVITTSLELATNVIRALVR